MIKDEKIVLKECLQDVIIQLQLGNPDDWGDYQFHKASEIIAENTSVNISVHTLKRLFGRLPYKEDYWPQIGTRNALAAYIGNEDWDDYKNKKKKPKALLIKPVKKIVIYLCVIFAVSILIPVLIKTKPFPSISDRAPQVTFYSPDTNMTYPATVRFKYELPKSGGPFYIDFGYPYYPDQKQLLNPKQNQINHLYFKPGVYYASIHSSEKKIKTIPVYVKNKEWIGIVNKGTGDIVKENFIEFTELLITNHHGNLIKNPMKDGCLFLPDSIFKNNDINLSGFYYSHFMRIMDYDCEGDNIIYEVRFKNPYTNEENVCRDVAFNMFGETGHFRVSFMAPGCFRWVRLDFGEKHYTGLRDDLNSFTYDYTEWTTLKLVVKNKFSTVILNCDTIFETTYENPVGAIKGLDFTMKGNGKIDYIKLFNSTSGELVYKDEF